MRLNSRLPISEKYWALIYSHSTSNMHRLAFILFYSLCFCALQSCSRSKNFDVVSWNEDVSERYKMAQDLESSKILIGKTRREVYELLGDENCKSCDSSAPSFMYITGVIKQLRGADFYIFDVIFENDTVVRAEVRK